MDADALIVSERVVAAERATVYRAFSEPEWLARWWGPEEFTNTFHEFDFQPGGAWRFSMRGPDGSEYAMDKQFVEIVEPERIVHRNIHETHGFLMTVSLAEEVDGTRVTWEMLFDSADEAARVREPITAANEQNFDRLVALLADLA